VGIKANNLVSGFGGLGAGMLASGTQLRGFKPGRSRQIFQGKKKNPQHAFLWRGSKAISPTSQIFSMLKNSPFDSKIHRTFLAHSFPIPC
jgi:hypothetical protein